MFLNKVWVTLGEANLLGFNFSISIQVKRALVDHTRHITLSLLPLSLSFRNWPHVPYNYPEMSGSTLCLPHSTQMIWIPHSCPAPWFHSFCSWEDSALPPPSQALPDVPQQLPCPSFSPVSIFSAISVVFIPKYMSGIIFPLSMPSKGSKEPKT